MSGCLSLQIVQKIFQNWAAYVVHRLLGVTTCFRMQPFTVWIRLTSCCFPRRSTFKQGWYSRTTTPCSKLCCHRSGGRYLEIIGVRYFHCRKCTCTCQSLPIQVCAVHEWVQDCPRSSCCSLWVIAMFCTLCLPILVPMHLCSGEYSAGGILHTCTYISTLTKIVPPCFGKFPSSTGPLVCRS